MIVIKSRHEQELPVLARGRRSLEVGGACLCALPRHWGTRGGGRCDLEARMDLFADSDRSSAVTVRARTCGGPRAAARRARDPGDAHTSVWTWGGDCRAREVCARSSARVKARSL